MTDSNTAPRSCDRCHGVKHRCVRSPGSTSCQRCARLRFVCQVKRPIGKSGRRPQWEHADLSFQMLASDHTLATPSPPQASPSLFGDAPDELPWLVDRILTEDAFMQQFVLGLNFCRIHRQTLISHLDHSRDLLRDAYLACAWVWPSSGDISIAPNEIQLSKSYRQASEALKALRSIHIRDIHDVGPCLVLGGALLAYANRLGGHQSHNICIFVLSLIRDIYAASFESWPDSTLLSCFVLTDIAECLVKTCMPTLCMRLPTTASNAIDRYIGICTSLMPHLYELCAVNHQMLQGENAETTERLISIESVIWKWRPSISDTFVDTFTTGEICYLIGQAQVMKMAALLIIHRIRNPFGSADPAAISLSSAILSQLDYMQIVNKVAVPNMDFPLFVACLELADDCERSRNLRRFSSSAANSEQYQQRIEKLMALVWNARRRSSNMYWYHMGGIVLSDS